MSCSFLSLHQIDKRDFSALLCILKCFQLNQEIISQLYTSNELTKISSKSVGKQQNYWFSHISWQNSICIGWQNSICIGSNFVEFIVLPNTFFLVISNPIKWNRILAIYIVRQRYIVDKKTNKWRKKILNDDGLQRQQQSNYHDHHHIAVVQQSWTVHSSVFFTWDFSCFQTNNNNSNTKTWVLINLN